MEENVSLKDHTTLRLGGEARYFFSCKSGVDIVKAADFAGENKLPLFVLGGGSNIVVQDDVKDMVCLKMENSSIEVIKENNADVLVRVGAGTIWDDFVKEMVERGFSGIEALSMIPGTCGAAPIQNIGAYGSEASETIEEVRGYDLDMKKFETFSNAACRFGYRTSIFKNELKGKFVIESVIFKLSKNPPSVPQYPLVAETLFKVQKEFPDKSLLEQIRISIMRIRSNKLPDPSVVSNVGSFFKNVFVSEDMYGKIKSEYPELPAFTSELGYKIPTGWLIEKAGFKGYRENGVGVYDKNALVLVNYSAQNTRELLNLADKIKESVKTKFGLSIEIEPDII